jgi:hypothetical protein
MPGPRLRFRSPIEINKINPYVRVRPEQAARLRPNWRRPMPVRIQVNGKPDIPWRINLMPVGDGSFFLYLHGQVRKEAGTSVGDVVSLTIEFDDDYKGGPVDPMPPWFGDELQRNPAAQSGGDSLPPSRQKEILPLPGSTEILSSPTAQRSRGSAGACRRQSALHGEIMEYGQRRVTIRSQSYRPLCRSDLRLPPFASTRMVPGLARWAKFRRTMPDASSEAGCSRDQKQPYPGGNGSDGSRDALTGRCETFDSDGCRHDSHRAQVHDPDDEDDRR